MSSEKTFDDYNQKSYNSINISFKDSMKCWNYNGQKNISVNLEKEASLEINQEKFSESQKAEKKSSKQEVKSLHLGLDTSENNIKSSKPEIKSVILDQDLKKTAQFQNADNKKYINSEVLNSNTQKTSVFQSIDDQHSQTVEKTDEHQNNSQTPIDQNSVIRIHKNNSQTSNKKKINSSRFTKNLDSLNKSLISSGSITRSLSANERSRAKINLTVQETSPNPIINEINNEAESKNLIVEEPMRINKKVEPIFQKRAKPAFCNRDIKLKHINRQSNLNKLMRTNKSIELQKNHNVHFSLKSMDIQNKTIENATYFETCLLECPIIIKPKKRIDLTKSFEYNGLKCDSSLSLKMKNPIQFPLILSNNKTYEAVTSFKDQMKHKIEKNTNLKRVEVSSKSILNIFKEHIDDKIIEKEQFEKSMLKKQKQSLQRNLIQKMHKKFDRISEVSSSCNNSEYEDNVEKVVKSMNVFRYKRSGFSYKDVT